MHCWLFSLAQQKMCLTLVAQILEHNALTADTSQQIMYQTDGACELTVNQPLSHSVTDRYIQHMN